MGGLFIYTLTAAGSPRRGSGAHHSDRVGVITKYPENRTRKGKARLEEYSALTTFTHQSYSQDSLKMMLPTIPWFVLSSALRSWLYRPLQPSVIAAVLYLRFDRVHRLLEPIQSSILHVVSKDLGYPVQPLHKPLVLSGSSPTRGSTYPPTITLLDGIQGRP